MASQGEDRAVFEVISRLYPTVDSAVAEQARLEAEATLPAHTVHVISDVHGDDVKLRHVINNASGTLRPLVQQLFEGRKSPKEMQSFLTLIFYPSESLSEIKATLKNDEQKQAYVAKTLQDLFEVVRWLARNDSLHNALRVFPQEYSDLFGELLHAPSNRRDVRFFEAMERVLARHDRAWTFIRLTVRVLRNLAIHELVLAGDCWDRGARGDKVVDYLMYMPRVSFIWGNHDTAWLGACLGSEACIAHVLRISARYRNFTQLEEGYGITLQPLERLVREAYAEDPAEVFRPKKTEGLRDSLTMARLQKAVAIMQFKLEGQLIERNPQWGLMERRLLHRIDATNGTINIEGKTYPLRDTHFPTIDPSDPYRLSDEEQRCMDRLTASFKASDKLWEQMKFLVERGSMVLSRSDNLIFHGCVPVNEQGDFLPLVVDGKVEKGKALFDALDRVITRAIQERAQADLDLLWYLWCGPRSPLFGKDKITTLENDLIADKSTHEENKNPYFRLIHEPWFCDRVMAEFGIDPQKGLIVNGHVPVKLEQGESPLKRSGKAITIDGAFSQAYGDHGYTLVLEPGRTVLAKHHHFESVEAAVRDGVDIIPEVTEIRRFDPPKTVSDTEEGNAIRSRAELLARLISAYRSNQLRPVAGATGSGSASKPGFPA
jgi:fructose-1,6-bisphosphatase III